MKFAKTVCFLSGIACSTLGALLLYALASEKPIRFSIDPHRYYQLVAIPSIYSWVFAELLLAFGVALIAMPLMLSKKSS